jgi:hypothetical protein
MDVIPANKLAEEIKLGGEAEFRKKYPHPFLVVLEYPEEEEDEILPPKTAETDVGALLAKKDSLEAIGAVPLVKSDRNAFMSKITIGRARNNDIVLRATKVSKLHCEFVKDEEGGLKLSDLGSVNGTILNKNLLDKQTPPTSLNDGDLISVWRYVFKFYTLNSFIKFIQSS